MRKFLFMTTAAISLMAVSGTARASAIFHQISNFTSDASTASTVQAVAAGTYYVRSISYAGGVDPYGITVSAGGFDPMITIFDAMGNVVFTQDDGPLARNTDPVTGKAYDFAFTITLPAGSYTFVVSEFVNSFDGTSFDPTFSTSVFGCSNGVFCDDTGVNRSANFAYYVTDTAPSLVPEPAAIALLGVGLLGLGMVRRRA